MKQLWLKVVAGGFFCLLSGVVVSGLLKRKKIVKKRLIDLIGNTPLIYLKCLSE